MISKPIRFFACIVVLFFLLPHSRVYAQLSNFSLTITPNHETCTGNGSLSFTVSNTSPGASIFYSIYRLPDTTTPIAVINSNLLTGLSSGLYQVIATQSLGALSNTQQQTVTVNDNRNLLQYQAVCVPINCQRANIDVQVAHGNPVTYEIISGPVIVPPQSSNILANLPLGQYTVKVTDACGDALVQACTLFYEFDPDDLIFPTTITYQQCSLLSCNQAQISVPINAALNATIPYPFYAEITIYPPGGGTPVIINQTVNSGNPFAESIEFAVPFYNHQSVSYSIKITDFCNNVSQGPVVAVGSACVTLELSAQDANVCETRLGIAPCGVMYPITLNFLSAPADFNPIHFNPGGLGPYNTPVVFFSNDQYQVPTGNYLIQVTDACGRVIQGSVEVPVPKSLGVIDFDYKYYEDCVLYFPINIPASTVPIQTITLSGAPQGYPLALPHDFTGQIEGGAFIDHLSIPGIYTYTGVNICGNPYTVILEIPEILPQAITETGNEFGCDNLGSITVSFQDNPEITSVVVVQAPLGYNHPLPHDVSDLLNSPDFDNEIKLEHLPSGDYVIQVNDECNFYYPPLEVNVPLILYEGALECSVSEGCLPGLGSIQVGVPFFSNTGLSSITMISAPASYAQTMPYDVSFLIDPFVKRLYMNNLPEGDYEFTGTDFCGKVHTGTLNIGNHFYNTNVEIQGFCGAFNLFLTQDGNSFTTGPAFLLQKFNPNFNRWEHPYTGVPYSPNSFPNGQNSLLLSSNNYNLTAIGHFRVIKVNYIYSNGSSAMIPCVNVLTEFDFLGTLKITDAFKMACSGGTSQVLIVAGDTSPLTYEIIEKDGQSFYVNNQNSNLFNGLAPAIYKFKVTDGCGNIAMRLFDVTVLSEPVVSASELCDGQEGQLSVQPFSFLSYQWWSANDPNLILSTTSNLHFSPFSVNTTPGTYYVRIYSESPLSCIDITVPYTIQDRTNPRAGEDNAATICARNAFDLNPFRSGIYDAYGYWIETTNSGMLNGHFWLPAGLSAGTYTFKYIVPGFCDFFDEAVFDITLIDVLQAPDINMSQQFCQGDAIQFQIQTMPNVSYSWTGPNNFSSLDANPQILQAAPENNGVYTVKAQAYGCESSAEIQINVSPQLLLSMKTICANNNQILYVVPLENSFDPETATYFWQGPDGYSSHDEQVVLNSLNTGNYSVTVTDVNGCSQTQSTEILKTKCAIPAGVSPNVDGSNETFDLTGFGVIELEIFNRYGTLVYEQDDYTDQWHGQDYNDHTLPDGIYFYYLKLQSGEEKTGWVYVTK